jgi:ubiquinone/menaquinone biosynthesis C-methylase UbiE
MTSRLWCVGHSKWNAFPTVHFYGRAIQAGRISRYLSKNSYFARDKQFVSVLGPCIDEMSRQGRYVIDRMKVWAARWNLQLPVPPYDDVNYWEGVYRSMPMTDPSFEWGNVSCADLLHHSYRPILIASIPSLSSVKLPYKRPTLPNNEGTVFSNELRETSLGEFLGVHPNTAENQSILILGCGTSRFGEDLLTNNWKGPIIQLDCSSRLVENLNIHYASYIQSGKMIVVHDDATILSALQDNSVHSVFDKGLMDALFCTDSFSMMSQTLLSVHRVLRPDATFCCLSLSHPEFVIPKLLPSLFPMATRSGPNRSNVISEKMQQQSIHRLWSHIEVRLVSDYMYCYRFTKKPQRASAPIRPKVTGPR